MPWEQLGNIAQRNRQEARQQAMEKPIACPIEGDILDVRDDGIRNCPLGNFRWQNGMGVFLAPL